MAKQPKVEPPDEGEPPLPPFEKSLEELDSVVKQLESADVPLDQALALFERGMKLSEACRKQLQDAETRIEILLKKGESIEASPFEDDTAAPPQSDMDIPF